MNAAAVEQTLISLAIGFTLAELLSRGALTRFVLRHTVRMLTLSELLVLRVFRRILPPRYVLQGSCQQRGTCCTMIIGNPPRFIKKRPFLLGLFAGYHRVMHNFEVVRRGPEDELIFACGHLQTDGRCGIYRTRPFLCRNFPIQPFFVPPMILPGCGYRVVPRTLLRASKSPRASLPVLNQQLATHHPTRLGGRQREEQAEDFVMVDIINPPP